jgi:hypothetical protein
LSEEREYLEYYVGIWPFDETEKIPLGTDLVYEVKIVQISCLTRNEDENEWTGKGCEVGQERLTEYSTLYLVHV